MDFEAVIYDYGGVFSPSPFTAIKTYENDLGVERGTVFGLLFGRSYAHGEHDDSEEHDWHKLERGELTMDEWLGGVNRGAEELFGPEFEFDIARAFSGGGARVYWEMVHHSQRVKAAGYKTAVLTNNIKEYGDHWRATIPLSQTMDAVIDSSEVGLRKPDPAIYSLTANELNVNPETCVFVDDLQDNIDGCQKVGMTGVLATDPGPTIKQVEKLIRL